VQIRFFDDRDQLYNAMKLTDEADRVDIIVEDTSHAMSHLKRQRLADVKQEYLDAKELYEKKLDIIWLKPLGFRENQTDALNKLAGTIDDETFNDLESRVSGGEKPKNVAKDFLRTKKLI
jgi:glycine betaine/choline ABC-type transport system substrate-binding protein